MRVYIGHILFPPTASVLHSSNGREDVDKKDDIATRSVKRFKGEGWTAGVKETTDIPSGEVSAASVTAAVLQAIEQQLTLKDRPKMDVHMHTAGKGASFCFLPGILSQSLNTSISTAITCPENVTSVDIETAVKLPRITEVSLGLPNSDVSHRLQVYWEERQMVTTNSKTAETDTSNDVDKLLGKRILVVGAGGIGCELLKVLVLYGFNNLDVFDLDTIDATNLNRQFLFQKEDVGASKAETARKALLKFFSSNSSEQRRTTPTICAHHADIKNDTYDDAFFSQFALVLNALDNVSARQHVNRMCMRTGVPLIESGTMGYNGQVQPIVRSLYECYDCHPKAATQKTVAVCTIHARPTTMVHCVHYAKELYERLFGDEKREEKDEFAFIDALLAQQEEAQKEPNSRDSVSGVYSMAAALALCLFHDKINELLSLKTTWATQPPVPIKKEIIQRITEEVTVNVSQGKSIDISRDNAMSLEEIISLFLNAFTRCVRRGTRDGFRKEDDDTVDFVAAVANLRANVFHILPLQSVEEIRSIAGAIVPAIATTNAIVAAAVVQQALCVLSMNKEETCRFAAPHMVYVRRMPQVRRRPFPESCGCNGLFTNDSENGKSMNGDNMQGKHPKQKRWTTDMFLVHSAPLNPPSKTCLVCRDRYPTVRVLLDVTRTTLRQFVYSVLRDRLSMTEASVFCGGNVLYEEGEYEVLAMKPLAELMTAVNKPLELLVDDLDHEVEWRLVVSHCAEMGKDDAVELEGLDAALQLEQSLIAESKMTAENAENGDGDSRLNPTNTAGVMEGDSDVPASPAVENGGTVLVVLSDSEEEDVDIVEID